MADYYRGDQRAGITAPDLSKTVDYVDHIVKARGKRTQYTSVSKEPGKIRDFGEQLYKLKRDKIATDAHDLVEHDRLMETLRSQALQGEKAVKLKAVQALRYSRKRLEGIVAWSFDHSSVARKDLITWAQAKVQPYFVKQ